MSVFLNEEIKRTAGDASKYCDDLEKALYEQFKSAYCLTLSNNFHGGSADSYKNYIQQVSIYFINLFLNTADELKQVMTSIEQTIHSYESDESGIVDQSTVEDVSQKLLDKNRSFSSLVDEIWSIDSEAAAYISIMPPSFEAVDGDFSRIQRNLSKVQDDFILMNCEAEQKVSSLSDRISKLVSDVAAVDNSYHYAGSKRINFEKLAQITSEKWYQPESSKVLSRMLTVDPFSYQTGRVAAYEGQWAKRFSPDIYAYAGASALSANYEYKHDNGTSEIRADASGLSGTAYAQATDWLRASAEAEVASGSIDAKVGWSDQYKGFKVEGEGAVAKAEGSVKVGTDNFNGYVDGDAEFGSADGYAALEYEDKNDYNFGFSGEATAAKAEASFGFSALKVRAKEKVNGKKQETNLIGLHGSVEATGGGSIGAGISSKNIYDGSFVDVNAVTIKFNIAALLGVNLDITIPELSFS